MNRPLLMTNHSTESIVVSNWRLIQEVVRDEQPVRLHYSFQAFLDLDVVMFEIFGSRQLSLPYESIDVIVP
jgi:hypothetical protein